MKNSPTTFLVKSCAVKINQPPTEKDPGVPCLETLQMHSTFNSTNLKVFVFTWFVFIHLSCTQGLRSEFQTTGAIK